MFASLETARQEASGVRVYLLATYYVFTSHVWLPVLLYGLALMALGATIVPAYHEIFAAMLGVWGITMAGLGGLGLLVFLGKSAYARLNTA